ncbi:MAG TPA: sulfite exporter TauE/SafE family protein, partial [Spirochaetota bacterium]|nr:sulfite exporter TauE/SafE family protein [Spirochaetota bacterium]
IFTPLFLGFTQIDSYIIRSTGLFVAMTGTLVAAKPFLEKKLANMRLVLIAALPCSLFAILGALLAAYINTSMGQSGEAFIRGMLGILVIAIAFIFIIFGKRATFPQPGKKTAQGEEISLNTSYYEPSIGQDVTYKVSNLIPGSLLFSGVGFISGLFGLGAGWAMVPVFNLIMTVPLKVAATTSTVTISLGNSAAIWPYIRGGGLFPLVAIPCMLGFIIGSRIGSRLMIKINTNYIKWIIISLMFLAGTRLIIKALAIARQLN